MDVKNKFYLLIFSIILFCFCLIVTRIDFTNDLFYTIENGKDILSLGLDFLDHSSWISLSYSHPHFLFDIFIFGVYHFFGFIAIHWFKVISFFLLASLFFKVIYKKTDTFFFSYLFTILFILFFSIFMTARVQIWSYFLFLFEYIILEKYSKSGERKYLYPLPFISLFLSNFHGAVLPFFYILILPYFASYVVHYIFKIKHSSFLEDQKFCCKDLLFIIVISFFTSLFNPVGIDSMLYSFKIMKGNTTAIILEHLPPTFYTCPQIYIFIIAFIILNVLFRISYRTSHFFLILGTFLMSFLGIRHYSFFLLLAIPSFLDDFFHSFSKKRILLYDSFFLQIFRKLSIVFLIILFIPLYFVRNRWNQSSFIPDTEYPVYAANYLLKNVDISHMRLFNGYDYGSYLLFRGIPVFVDSRSDLYTTEFNSGIEIFDDYVNIMKTGSRELIEKYDFTHLLIENKNSVYSTFYERYTVLYQDDFFTIFIRNNLGV